MFVVLLASVSYKLSVCLSKECFLSWHTHLSSFWLTSVGLFQLLDQVGSEGLLVVVSVEVVLNFGKSKIVLEKLALYPGCSVVWKYMRGSPLFVEECSFYVFCTRLQNENKLPETPVWLLPISLLYSTCTVHCALFVLASVSGFWSLFHHWEVLRAVYLTGGGSDYICSTSTLGGCMLQGNVRNWQVVLQNLILWVFWYPLSSTYMEIIH